MLNGCKQFDFDGRLTGLRAPYQVGSVVWYDAARFGKDRFVLDVADRTASSDEADSMAFGSSLADVNRFAGKGRLSVVLGIESRGLEALAEDRIPLLETFGVALVRWPGLEPAVGDSVGLEEKRQFFLADSYAQEIISHNQ